MSITPGPWKAVCSASGYFIAPQAPRGETVRIIATLDGPSEICKANARAIAAVPEMVELLLDAGEELASLSHYKELAYEDAKSAVKTYDKIHALLRRIEGEEENVQRG